MPEERSRRRPFASGLQPSRESLFIGLLILLNAGVFLMQRSAGLLPSGAGPAAPLPGAVSLPVLSDGAWWTVFTHLFIHIGWDHLLLNMILLWMTGRRVLTDCGPGHFCCLYFFSGWFGAALCLTLWPQEQLAGASGAVCGVIGAWAALYPDYSITEKLQRFFPWRLRAKFVFGSCVISSVALEITAHLTEKHWNLPMVRGVAHSAHAAGLLTGWLYARQFVPGLNGDFLYRREEFFPQGVRRRRREEETWPPSPSPSGGAAPPDLPFSLPGSPGARETARGGLRPAAQLPPPRRTDEEFLREEVDPVLDKLYASGMQSLSPEEREVLDKAARVIARRSRG